MLTFLKPTFPKIIGALALFLILILFLTPTVYYPYCNELPVFGQPFPNCPPPLFGIYAPVYHPQFLSDFFKNFFYLSSARDQGKIPKYALDTRGRLLPYLAQDAPSVYYPLVAAEIIFAYLIACAVTTKLQKR